ncbi:basic helix-loop-helix domain-containing protein USF3-like [Uloborus diversus]|uniref:basic helix-loop-helix domain-containing protein USF3-like n=1 Tax=Uloborus diversus TaxID=327109 RepID=UPI00240A1A1D|nr:basic helix-loop-helix domain-containing protein USF3-like [Uloborus diversus]
MAFESGKSKSRGSRKRQVHNEVERRRKDKINGWISKIAELLPIHEWQKQSKISILEHTVDYIKLLTSEKEKLLSDNCLEVQVEEIKKLKKDLEMVKEQNTAYEKLLHQANISLSSLPKKTLKYSDEFAHRNGILTLKNNKFNGCTTADCAVQVNSDLILNISDVSEGENNITSKSTPRSSNSVNSKNSKNAGLSKVSSSTVKSSKTIVTSSAVLPIVPATVHSTQSNVTVANTMPKQNLHHGNRISQENIISIINWNDPVRNSSTLHAGGVTTVLSQFPVMSTSHSSTFANVCPKNMPTIIIPAGGSTLQPFSHPEKSSNTISIICPSTLPIFVPQQVLNVSSMARNVGVASALICPAPVNNPVSHTETPALSSTLVTLNPSSIVPISSTITANAQIILPPQSSETANVCSNGNVAQSISLINPTIQAASDQLSVPSAQPKTTLSEGVNSPNSERSSTSSKSNALIKAKEELNLSVSKNNSSILQTNALESRNDKDLVSPSLDASLNSSDKQASKKEQITQCESNKRSPCKEKRNISLNSLPSLQVLSANKIISLASQTQKVRPNLILPLYKKSSDDASVVSLQTTKSQAIQNSNNFCLQIDSPCVSKVATNDHNTSNTANPPSSSSMPSKFSLTVLMGSDSPDKPIHVTQNEKSPNQSSGEMAGHTSNELPVVVPSAAIDNSMTVSHGNSPENVSLIVSTPNKSTELPKLNENVDTSSTFSNVQNRNNNLNIQKTCNCKPASADINANDKSLSSNINNIPTPALDIPKSNVLSTNISTEFSSNIDGGSKNRLNPENNFVNQTELSLTPYSKGNSASVKEGLSIPNTQSTNSENQQNRNVAVEVNVFGESISYIVDEKDHQNILPTFFANNQISSHHSSVYMCSTSHENISSNANNINETNPMNTCLLPDSCSDLYNFQSLNKEITISNSYTVETALNSPQKRANESYTELSRSSSGKGNILNMDNKNVLKNNKSCTLNSSCTKQIVNKKKKIPNAKALKTNLNTVKMNASSDGITDVSSSVNKSSAIGSDTSFAKSNTSNCYHQEQSPFVFTSDILARATESIFGNDILENSHLPKKSNCFSDDTTNPNVSTSEKNEEDTYKLQYPEENVVVQAAVPIEQKEKKANTLDEIQMHGMDGNASTDVGNLQDPSHKPVKISRSRKAKSVGDIEPPYKKVKEMLVTPEKQSDVHIFQQIHQTEKREEKQASVDMQLNVSPTSKQLSSEMQVQDNTQANADSTEQFGNQIHMSESSCKTQMVDNIFSLTPMLGDILKDVSHNNNNLEPRGAGLLSCNDSQNLFQADKNFMSFNYTSTANEDYMNLPRMYFPIIPDISAASVVQVTNVSYAHSVSLCSTQSDSMKTTETVSASDAQNKPELKKSVQPVLQENQNSLNCEVTSNLSKHSECVLKLSDSEPQFTNTAPKLSSNSSLLFEGQNSEIHAPSLSHANHTINSTISQNNLNYMSRETFAPTVSHNITFYPTISSSSTNVQNFPSVSSMLPHSNYLSSNSSSLTTLSFPVPVSSAPSNTNTFSSQSASSKSDSLSHSLCSLLKENTSSVVESRSGAGGSTTVQNVSTSTNTIQSKYSALSLISDQTSYSDSVSSAACHSDYPQTTLIYTPTSSETHFTSTASTCGRNQRTSLSYSAESLLQTSCANSEKSKNKFSNRYQQRVTDKKSDRIASIHNMTDTNIFMPVSNCELNIQNVPLVPLPPVTTFQNFSSSYSLCDTVPSTTIFNTVARTHEIPLSHSNDNFLNHVNLSVESQILNNRHENSAVPKPHSNIPLPFENHGTLYNSCNFLPHVKPTIESSRPVESTTCFQPTSFNNNYSQPTQKPNCCHFSHRTLSGNPELTTDISLPITGTSVPSFHAEKGSYPTKRPALQPTFSQSNSNFVGNFFYPTANVHDGNDITSKLPNLRPSQDAFAPDGIRQNTNDSNSGIIFNNRKNITSNRSKSKKGKSVNPNESNINLIPNSMANFSSTQDPSCNKVNLPCVSNGYFKNNSHAVIASQNQLSCPQTKMSESSATSVMPSNPPFNPLLHQQGDNFLSLNFQPPNFAVSPLSRPPTQPLSCSCLTAPIISHTFSSTAHPVPNFNLSNILPDMSCSGSQVSISPVKFPTMNHALPTSTTQCQTNSNIGNSAHIVSHQSCTPSLYPPHPPLVRGTLNPIIGHNSQSLNENQVPLVGAGGPVPQNTFSATQNPTFRNVIHSLPFSRTNR